ncbi:MAG: hypothetical protein EPO26_18870 [Chloroflexota bacterium]|nr:MAG: hypothetical protein EPO26_18870 [Chloroflexota bacterium]
MTLPSTAPSWSTRLPARWARALIWQFVLEPFVRTFYDLSSTGRTNLARIDPPAIFAANHCAHLDNGFIIMSLPFRWRSRLAIAAATQDIFGKRHFGLPIKGMLARLLGNGFPFSRRGKSPRLAYFRALLARGWSVLLYPEGRLTIGEAIGPFLPGVGIVAVESGVPVIPVRVVVVTPGPWEGGPRLSRGRTIVKFGAPLRFPITYDPAAATTEIAAAVAAL